MKNKIEMMNIYIVEMKSKSKMSWKLDKKTEKMLRREKGENKKDQKTKNKIFNLSNRIL